MALTGYVGITIRDDYLLSPEDLIDVEQLSLKLHNNCLYAISIYGDSAREIEKLSLDIPAHQLIHIKNQLKRVKNDRLYAAFNDNFGVHILNRKKQVVVKRR
jgi:hypothetical protein